MMMARTVLYETIGQPCWVAFACALRVIAAIDSLGLLKASPSINVCSAGCVRRARFGTTGNNPATPSRR